MAEVSTNVYDILFPSPPALKDIAAISIALHLWRQEINTHRIKNTLNKLNLQENILSTTSMPRIPTMILSAIEKYVKQIGLSIKRWLIDHSYPDLFDTEIFNDFIDFMADFNGSIHYDWTAKRFVRCDKVDKLIRFRIACKYCFEDDILRIWPSVSRHDELKFNTMSFYSNALLIYWICRARNQLYKLPRSFHNTHSRSIEEEVFYRSLTPYDNPCSTWSLVKYFWDRFDSDTRIRFISQREACVHEPYRYLLAIFNEVELEKFAITKGNNVIYDLLCNRTEIYVRTCDNSYFECDVLDRAPLALAIWTHIKEKINEGTFFSFFLRLLRLHGRERIRTPICCELWNTAPKYLKAYVIQQLLSENSFVVTEADEFHSLELPYIDGSFLLAVLSDAPVENKNTFWEKHWRCLINAMLAEEYDQVMRLCFNSDESRIVEFKRNTLTTLASIRVKCVKLLNDLSIEELNTFLKFCYPDERTRRSIQLNLLVEEFKLNIGNIANITSVLNDYINDAFDDLNLAADFKTQLLYSPSTMETFTKLIDSYSCGDGFFEREVNFIDPLAPTQQMARDLKKLYFIPLLQQKLIAGNFKSKVEENEFSNFISECANNEDEIAQLKTSLSTDEMVQNVIRNAMSIGGPKYNFFLVDFLEWYFVTSTELDEFKARYYDDDVFVKLITQSA